MSQSKKPPISTPKLSEQLCFSLYAASLAMNQAYRKLLVPLGITYPQYLVLLVLWEQDVLTVSGIGDRLFLDSATLTPMLKRMEALQFVSRERGLDDERQVIIALMPLGEALRGQAEALSAAALCATKCSATEVNVLSQQLIKLRAGLSQDAQHEK